MKIDLNWFLLLMMKQYYVDFPAACHSHKVFNSDQFYFIVNLKFSKENYRNWKKKLKKIDMTQKGFQHW